jgi:hypothetical protein
MFSGIPRNLSSEAIIAARVVSLQFACQELSGILGAAIVLVGVVTVCQHSRQTRTERQRVTAQEYTTLQMELAGESNAILARAGLRPFDAYNAMLREPEHLSRWWGGAFEQSEDEGKIIDAAAKCFAAREPLPNLTIEQLARLAVRLRIGSRIIRAISSRAYVQPKGWFANKLRRMTERELVEWILIEGWHFWAEIFDEAHSWADEVEPPPAPSMRRRTAPPSEPDSSTFAE